MKAFIYQDTKHKPIMVYMRREYPYGDYLGHFDTMQQAEQEIKEYQEPKQQGIPLCDALVQFKIDHGQFDMEGLKLLTEVNA